MFGVSTYFLDLKQSLLIRGPDMNEINLIVIQISVMSRFPALRSWILFLMASYVVILHEKIYVLWTSPPETVITIYYFRTGQIFNETSY